jgi:hypothetical protein
MAGMARTDGAYRYPPRKEPSRAQQHGRGEPGGAVQALSCTIRHSNGTRYAKAAGSCQRRTSSTRRALRKTAINQRSGTAAGKAQHSAGN